MNRAGVFATCILLSHIAAWYHMPMSMIGAFVVAVSALIAVSRKLRTDSYAARARVENVETVQTGFPPHVAKDESVNAAARAHYRRYRYPPVPKDWKPPKPPLENERRRP